MAAITPAEITNIWTEENPRWAFAQEDIWIPEILTGLPKLSSG